MRTLNQLCLVAALLSLTACTATKPVATATPPATQSAKHFQVSNSQAPQANYLLYLPQDYDAKSAKRWPLMLFLHGAGERGTNVWKVAVHGPPKNLKNNENLPFIVVSPQCPEGQIWSDDLLLGLLDEVIRTHAVDTNRVYLTGLSMGGYGTWHLGLAHPERFAAIAPICGGGEMITVLLSNWDKAQALKSLGVWAFHGAKDPVVPLAESQRMVDALKKAGVQEVKFTVYPEASHDSWTETYKNPELYQWLLQHERQPAK